MITNGGTGQSTLDFKLVEGLITSAASRHMLSRLRSEQGSREQARILAVDDHPQTFRYVRGTCRRRATHPW